MLVDKGYDPQYGARPMRRAIERLLEDPIAEAILRGDLTAGHSSRATRPEGTNRIEFEETAPANTQPKPKKAAATRKKKSAEAPADAAPKKRAPRRKKGDA